MGHRGAAGARTGREAVVDTSMLLGLHRMLGFRPGDQLAVHKFQVDELPFVALLGGRVKERGRDIVAVGAFGVAPDLSVRGEVGSDVGLAIAMVYLGHRFAYFQRFLHMPGADLGASLVGDSAS